MESSVIASYLKSQSTSSISRTNDFFIYDNFDSISAFSGSTVLDSEVAAERVRQYGRELSVNDNAIGKPSNVYNLRISKVVIGNGAKPKDDSDITTPVTDAVNKILTDLNISSEHYKPSQKHTKQDKLKSVFRKPKVFVAITIFIICVISLAVALLFVMNNENGENRTTIAPGTTSASTPETPPTTKSPQTTLTPTTTTSTTTTPQVPVEDDLKVFKRDAWLEKGLDVIGKYKQLTPVKRVIILNVWTDSCRDEDSCTDFIAEHQQNAYPEYDDIKENFLIGSAGELFEGRGFLREGQTTFESQTSYNQKAVSIGFILKENEKMPNDRQRKAFCKFVAKSISENDLEEDFLVSQHSAPYDESLDDLFKELCDLNWNERVSTQIMQMLGECKNVFSIICLGDQADVLEKYVETLSSTLENFLGENRNSSHDIIMKCYENFEALCLKPLPDKEIESIMYLIFCRTVDLHFITTKRSNRNTINVKHGESISDFFVYLLSNYSDKTKNVLLQFIKSLLSNVEHKFEREKHLKLLDVAVKYELAIFWKCNSSLVEFLEMLALASDHRQRVNGAEFCGKMLLINSTPEPDQQTLQVEIPREVFIIKILFEKIYDKQDNVKLKALTALKTAMINGNDCCKKVFGIVFNPNSANESNNNPEIVQILGKEVDKFHNSLLALLQTSQSTYIRKTCLEILAQNCECLIDNEIFKETITSLTDDPSYLVKVQLLEIVNSLLSNHSKNKKVLEMWLEVVLNLMKDNDNKIVDASIKSLTTIFQKIESFENTVSDQHLLPWNIIRLIMAKGKRNVLQNAMSALTTNFLSQDKLRKIETHIFTSNKSEAWCLLSIVAKRMVSNNPDIVVKTFIDHINNLNDPSHDATDFHLVLEVIKNWANSLNKNSKLQIVAKLTEVLESGSCSISLIHHIYEIGTEMRTLLFGKDDTLKLIHRLNDRSKKYILNHSDEFTHTTAEKVLCHLLIYCESNTDLPKRPDRIILDFMFSFVRKVLNEKLMVSLEHDVPRKLNCCIIVLTRFAIRDNELASELTPDLAMLLRKNTLHMSVIKTVMQCLNDLCKKHTSTVAPVFKEIIYKLHSQNQEIRLCALANIYDLVMQDFIKMKGRVLLNFLACLVDKNETIQLKSQAAILSYTNDKNQNLLYTCFLESVFLFNDFVQTENLGVFPLEEIDRNYRLLYGDVNRPFRHELYLFFVQNINDLNEVHLLMLLKQIIVIKEKLEKGKFKKSSNGVETFKDLLHIFKLVCEKRGESKMNVTKAENPDYGDKDEPEEEAQTSGAAQPKGGKKKAGLTASDALPVIEKMILIYPSFASLMIDYDNSLKPSVEELTKSIVDNFPTFIEYTKPESFWNQAQYSVKATTSRKRKSAGKRNDKPNDSSDDEDLLI